MANPRPHGETHTNLRALEYCARELAYWLRDGRLKFRAPQRRPSDCYVDPQGAKGYCVDTVGLDADMIRKYVRYQEKKKQEMEQLQLID